METVEENFRTELPILCGFVTRGEIEKNLRFLAGLTNPAATEFLNYKSTRQELKNCHNCALQNLEKDIGRTLHSVNLDISCAGIAENAY